jgi:hypothetical protein
MCGICYECSEALYEPEGADVELDEDKLKQIEGALNAYVQVKRLEKYYGGADDTRHLLEVREIMKVLREKC